MARMRKTLQVEPAAKRWLSRKEAMKYLGCGEDLLDKLREKKEISFSRYGGMIWYELASIDRFILKNKVV